MDGIICNSMFFCQSAGRISWPTHQPTRIVQGEWTGVVGMIEGTVSKPLPIGNGRFIEPTNKPYKLTVATFGDWTNNSVMDEEYLFWDNQAFYKQIGLAT